MISLEDQIARIADEAESQLERGALEQSTRAGVGGTRVLVGAAAAALVLGGVIVLPWVLRGGGATPSSEPSAASLPFPGPRPLEPNEPTVDADPADRWLYPSTLPDGIEFLSAVDYGELLGGDFRTLDFGSQFSGAELSILVNPPSMGPSGEGDEIFDVEATGVTWSVARSGGPDGPARLTAQLVDAGPVFGDESIDSVSVSATGVDLDDLTTVLDGLDAASATELPRPPLSLFADGAVVVAEVTQDGVPKRLEANTDGVTFAMSIGGGGGSPVRLADRYLAVDGASGPNPNLVGDGNTAESLVWGLVHPDVATVEVALRDGTSIVSAPQDQHGFSENFFAIAFPTTTEGGLEQLVAVVARDADGRELERDATLAE